MVSGILPVVELPLPLFSYGGTGAVTLLVSFGLIMAAQREQFVNALRVVPDLVSVRQFSMMEWQTTFWYTGLDYEQACELNFGSLS